MEPIIELLDRVDERLRAWIADEIPNSQYPASAPDVARLTAALREMMGENERLRGLVYLPKILDDDEQVTFADHSASLLRRHDSLRARVKELEAALRDILDSGVEFDDARLDYVTMQVDRVDIELAKAALAATEKE